MSQIENMKSFVAAGTIARGRAVYVSDEFKVLTFDGTALSVHPVGIAQNHGNKAPGTPFELSTGIAAQVGDTLMVYTDGADDAPGYCGGTITAGDSLGVDSTGRLVSSSSNATSFHWLVGYAKESGSLGDMIRIHVNCVPIAVS